MDYLAEIQNSQTIANAALQVPGTFSPVQGGSNNVICLQSQGSDMRQLMAMMQQVGSFERLSLIYYSKRTAAWGKCENRRPCTQWAVKQPV
jgi:hypothetical protein